MFDIADRSSDYVLRWPRDLFVLEAKALLATAPSTSVKSAAWTGEVSFLLSEAFASETPEQDFGEVESGWSSSPAVPADDPWETPSSRSRKSVFPEREFLEELVAAASTLPEQHAPRAYYSKRIATPVTIDQPERDIDSAQREWLAAIYEFQHRGYLQKAAPDACVDDDFAGANPDDALDALIADRIGSRGLWSPQPSNWDEMTFFDLIEIFHDLVARPRRRHFHNFDGCGWHYSVFTPRPAQILYRWTINRILARNGVELRLAESGEDVGRLVADANDARSDLIEAALAAPDPTRRDSVAHAVALFRSRGATIDEKRSACVTLAGLLEERRGLLKKELFSTDEGDLFLVANKFGIRHRNASQKKDYDAAYLDWIFWWYLATNELTDRLLARQANASSLGK
ncbi:hypothetical protein [Nocardia noduli]|uniref:hypothetical protein n=1 Tax=Nocardia noduli TaxID=2815722 RepID=UPI001C2436A5|nr:hypothetical protein [Nocardia noduli]